MQYFCSYLTESIIYDMYHGWSKLMYCVSFPSCGNAGEDLIKFNPHLHVTSSLYFHGLYQRKFLGDRSHQLLVHLSWSHFTNKVQRNLTGSKISTSSTKFVFLQADRKTVLMAVLASNLSETFWTTLLQPLNWIQQNLTGSNVSFFFRTDWKTKMSV